MDIELDGYQCIRQFSVTQTICNVDVNNENDLTHFVIHCSQWKGELNNENNEKCDDEQDDKWIRERLMSSE